MARSKKSLRMIEIPFSAYHWHPGTDKTVAENVRMRVSIDDKGVPTYHLVCPKCKTEVLIAIEKD